MSTNSKARKFQAEIDEARTMLASELVEKILTLTPVAIGNDMMVGLILTREIAWELVKQAQVIVQSKCTCTPASVALTQLTVCKHTQAASFIDNLHHWLESDEERKTQRIIRPDGGIVLP